MKPSVPRGCERRQLRQERRAVRLAGSPVGMPESARYRVRGTAVPSSRVLRRRRAPGTSNYHTLGETRPDDGPLQ